MPAVLLYASRLAASALLRLPNAAFPSPTMMPSLSSKHSALARAPRIPRLFVIMVLINPNPAAYFPSLNTCHLTAYFPSLNTFWGGWLLPF